MGYSVTVVGASFNSLNLCLVLFKLYSYSFGNRSWTINRPRNLVSPSTTNIVKKTRREYKQVSLQQRTDMMTALVHKDVISADQESPQPGTWPAPSRPHCQCNSQLALTLTRFRSSDTLLDWQRFMLFVFVHTDRRPRRMISNRKSY